MANLVCRLMIPMALSALLLSKGAAATAPTSTAASGQSRPATRAVPVVIEKTARQTLTAVEMNAGDELRFKLSDGTVRSIVLKKTSARVTQTTTTQPRVAKRGGVTNYRFSCILTIDGQSVQITREVASQRSFYEPRELMGLKIWFDACDDIFNFLTEEHGECRPRKQARFAIQEAGKGGRIAPVLLHPWCPLPEGGLRVEDCYNGEDVWLGAFEGADAHSGLDINHPAGTPIWAPIAIDDHFLFDVLGRDGANNNRWRGFHRWPDGSTWVLQVHHLIRLRVPERRPIEAGALLADGAGVYIGDHEHSHFMFKVIEPGSEERDAILLDPWILFWQMYHDRKETGGAAASR